jgi:hypothetical protein
MTEISSAKHLMHKGAVSCSRRRASRDADRVTDAVIHKAARAAVRGAEPLAMNEYKVGLVQKLVTEALQELRA